MALEIMEIDLEVNAKIKVVGVGGGGGNAVDNMIVSALQGVTFIAANTDLQVLNRSKAEVKIQLGSKLTKGLGAGGKPSIGCEAAKESIDLVRSALEDADMVFVTAGMGGGTGTGAAPVIAQTAKEMGALTVGVVTKPFFFEGKKRMQAAEAGIAEFRQHVDSLITIPNDRLLQLAPKKATFVEMLKKADDVLYYAVKSISDLIMIPGLINLDFADVRAVMGESGLAMMGTGIASGESRAREAATRAITSPLLEGVSIDGARHVLMNITCGPDLAIDEVSEAASIVQEAAHDDVHVFFGTVTDDSAGDEMRITVIATGIDQNFGETLDESSQNAGGGGRIGALASGGGGAGAFREGFANSGPSIPQGSPVPIGGNLNVPAYIRKNNGQGAPSVRPSAHAPGEDDFVFGEDDFETPSFMRKQAN